MNLAQNIRTVLLHPEKQQLRNDIKNTMATTQLLSTAAIVGSAAFAIFGLFLTSYSPILGGLTFVSGGGTAFASYEIHVISGNVLSLLNANPVKQLYNTFTSSWIADAILKGTWLINPFLRNTLITALDTEHK